MISLQDSIIGLGGLLFVGSAAWQGFLLIPRSRRYRTDLSPGQRVGQGSFPFWQMNVFNPRNYGSDEGRRFHRKLVLAAAIQLSGGLIVMLAAIFLDAAG